MAEEQNYVEGVNSARQRSRTARRQRGSDVLDSLESAGAMDRMRGVDVGGGFTGVTDTPAVNVVGAVASTGRSKAPVTTAGFGDRLLGRGPVSGNGYAVPRSNVTSTVVQSRCADGRCGLPRSPTIVGQPIFSENITTSSPVTTTVSPSPMQATTIGSPAVSLAPLDSSLEAIRRVEGASSAGDPTQVRASATAATLYTEAERLAMQERVNEHTRKINDQAAASDAMEAAAAARKTNAEAAAVESMTPEKFSEFRTKIVADAVLNGTSAPEFADKILAQRGLTYEVQDGQKATLIRVDQLTNEQRDAAKEDLMREAYGAHAAHLVVQSQQVWKRASQLTGADAEMIGRDPATGQPSTTPSGSSPVDQLLSNPAYRRSMDAIIRGFREQDLIGPKAPWSDLDGAVERYVAPTVQRYLREQYVKANADDIAAAKSDTERMNMIKFFEESGLQEADAYLGALRAELSMVNRSLGGEAMSSVPASPEQKPSSWQWSWPTIDFSTPPPQPPAAPPAQSPATPAARVRSRFDSFPVQ